MPRAAKSQWEFGELFPAAETRRVYSVSEITGTIRRLLEQQVGSVWVNGEITNLREQASGHIYFSLKDAGAQLQCVCFRSDARSSRHLLKDGQKVLLQGDVTVYEARGQYQIIVRAVEAQGIGALQAAFERLKQKLNAEGLFAPERKRPLPRFPQRIGIVTSPTGAALRDVLHVVSRRQPSLEMVLAPCRVQGQGAAEEIAAAIQLLNEFSAAGPTPLDLLLITRGGGSLEDLWAFNEEVVARAIFHSQLPVVSAVGHEIDFTIGDFVADLRAATPSAAAEIITETGFAARASLAETQAYLQRLARERMEELARDLRQCAQRLALLHPRRQMNEQAQRLDDLHVSLFRAARQNLRVHETACETLAQRLSRVRPSQTVGRLSESLHDLQRRLLESTRRQFADRRQEFSQAEMRLRLLSPLNVLQRGYSITVDDLSGTVVRAASQVRPGQKLRTRLGEGEVRSVAQD